MRFVIDADLPRDVVARLASYGHVGIDVRDIGMRRAEDPEIAAYALKNGLCLLTGDWGFSDIRIYPPDRSAWVLQPCTGQHRLSNWRQLERQHADPAAGARRLQRKCRQPDGV